MKNETTAKKILRTVISVFLSLVLALSLVVFGLLPILRSMISAESWTEIAVESGYGETMKEKVKEKFAFLSESSGVPASVYSAFLDENLSFEVAASPILGMFSDQADGTDREKLKTEFCEKVEEYAASLRESGELKLSEEEWAEMKADFPTLAEYYISELHSAIRMSGIFGKLGSVLQTVRPLVSILLAVVSVFFAFSLILLLLIQKRKVLVYTYLSFLSAGILLTAPALLLKLGNYVARLGVEPAYLKDLLVAVSEKMVQTLLTFGIAYIAIGIVCGVAAMIFSMKQSKKKEEVIQ